MGGDLFDLASAETAMMHLAFDELEHATTGTARLEALNTAIEHCFAVLELFAQLRVECPEQAEPLLQEWRGMVLRLRDMQTREVAR
jgi:hypothetical protein